MDGYIKLFRSLTEWEWYCDPNTLRVFIHCLIKANWKDGKFKGEFVPRGTFITSYASLAKDLKLTVKQVRVALEHLEKSGNVARKTASKWQAITVINYEVYQGEGQDNGKQEGSQRASKGQAKGKQRATIEERNKGIREEVNNYYSYTEDSKTIRERIKRGAM